VMQVDSPQGNYELKSRYVLAADDARSSVRQLCGLKLNGDAYEGRYVIADIQMHSDYPTERRAFFDPTSNPGLTILVHKQPDNIWRIDYQIGNDVDEEKELLEDNIRQRITSILAMIGETGPWQLEWWSLYSAYTLALDDYRHKRILFLGDAAHLVPIFGVRGLNSGIADAGNAAWKLAAVLNGGALDALLDTYSPERRGATLDVFENASKSAMFMTPPTRGYQVMRDAVLSLAVSHEFPRHLINPRQSQPYSYADSALTSFKNRDAEFKSGPHAGAALVNRRLCDNNYLLDHLGNGFTGLYFAGTDVNDEAVSQCFARLNGETAAFTLITIGEDVLQTAVATVQLSDADKLMGFYGAQPGTFYLVRPDRHICARWRSIQTEEVIAAHRQALGECVL
jgi:3-(3-hydroxy-phenyl)propionate hydroxylase